MRRSSLIPMRRRGTRLAPPVASDPPNAGRPVPGPGRPATRASPPPAPPSRWRRAHRPRKIPARLSGASLIVFTVHSRCYRDALVRQGQPGTQAEGPGAQAPRRIRARRRPGHAPGNPRNQAAASAPSPRRSICVFGALGPKYTTHIPARNLAGHTDASVTPGARCSRTSSVARCQRRHRGSERSLPAGHRPAAIRSTGTPRSRCRLAPVFCDTVHRAGSPPRPVGAGSGGLTSTGPRVGGPPGT